MSSIRRNSKVVIITLLIIIEISTMILMYKSLTSKSNILDEVKLNKIEKVMTYNESTNIVNLETNKTIYCYLYFNINNSICTLASDSSVSAGEYGAKYKCGVSLNAIQTFYLLDNNEDGTSDLIMNANINASGDAVIPGVTEDTGLVAWYADEQNNTNGPVTALDYLYNATKSWSNVEPLNYEYYDRETQGITDTTIGYQSFISTNGIGIITKGDTLGTQVTIGTEIEPSRARMPLYSSDANVTEVTNKTDTNAFLYENLENGAVDGYWTLSSVDDSYYAWYVQLSGEEVVDCILDSMDGVRPVITVKL